MPAGAGAVTLDGARSKALTATTAERTRGGVILFSLRAPVGARTTIREAGRPLASSGLRTRAMPSVLRLGRERAYFFYLDRGSYQASEHPGRVLLVGAVSGRVSRSRTIRFAPVINGRLPVFLRSREGYDAPAYRASVSNYSVRGAGARAASGGLGSFGAQPTIGLRSPASESAVAAGLAAERSCIVAVGGRSSSPLSSLGSPSGSPVLPPLVYTPTRSRSLASFVASEAIARRGCRDILIAVSGDGRRSAAQPSVRTHVSTTSSRMREYHVSAAMLRAIIAAQASVTFKLMIDAPGSGAFIEALRSLPNVLLIATSSTAGQTAFRHLPQKSIAGDLTRNPLRLRADSSFLTTQLFGAAAFAASDAEVAHASTEVAARRGPSFLAWMIARGFELSRPFDFTADVGATQRLYTNGWVATPPGPSNRAPVATAQSVTAVEDTPRAITLAGTDPDGSPLTFAIVGGPAHGMLSGTAPNLTFTPAADYAGPDSFTFTVSDGTLVSAVATVSITVTGVEDPPLTAASGTLAYTENDPATPIAPALTVTDIDSPNLTGATAQITTGLQSGADVLALPAQAAIAGAYDAASGTLTLSGSATVAAYQAALRAVTYRNTSDDPAATPRTVTFRARDAGGFGPAATRAITVAPVNDTPAIVTSAGPLSYTENDPATPVDAGLVLTDPDGQITGATVQITANLANGEDVLALASPPAGISAAYVAATGRLTLSGTAGVASYQAALRAVTYRNTSNNPSTAPRTVAFLASDASNTSAPATRAINVNAANNAPDVDTSAGSLAYTENAPATAIDTAITITDVDSANLTGATVQITGNHAPGQDVLDTPGALPGAITAVFDAATGRLTLTGTATVASYESALEQVRYRNTRDNPSTAPRTVTYQARDAGGFGLADTHGITVTAVDDPPVAVNDSATVAEDSGASAVAVLPNDTDVDAGAKSILSVAQPANGTVVITGGGTGLTYAPNANFCNTPPGTTLDTFTYTLTPGGSSATVSMSVTCTDDLPVAVNDSATVGEDSGANAVAVLINDTDIDGGPKSISSTTQPANATVVITGGGTAVTYAPNANYCNSPPGTSPDTFTYTVNGGSTANVSMTVVCVNDPPAAVNDAATVGEDSGAGAINVLANDTDVDGGPKAVLSATQPANGAVVITGGGTGVSYAPNANYCNSPPGTTPDTFTYTLNGGSTASVSVTVTCVNDPSIAVNDSATVGEDTGAGAVSVLANDTDVENNPITIVAASDPANGTVVLTGGSPGANTGLTYQPDPNYCNSPPGTTPDSFTYTINGGSTATVLITVTCDNDPPVAVNDSATVLEDALATALDVLANDTDADGGPKTVSSATDPANGTVVLTGGSPGAHTGLTYRPDPNYCNSPVGLADTFSYTLNGGSSAMVLITVTCVDDVPVAGDDSATVNEDAGPTAVNVLANDSDGDGGAVTIASASDPPNGTVVLAGGSPGARTGLTYQPDPNYCNAPPGTAPDTFTYTINDGDVGTVSMTVTCADDAPVAVHDSALVNEDSGANAVNALANDTDVDGGPKTISSASDPAGGTVVLTGGSPGAHTGLTYQPDPNYCNAPPGTSPDTFTYTINGGSTATVSVTVTCIDDPPTAVNDSATVSEDAPATAITVLTNDTDTDGGPKTISSASDPSNATVVLTGGSPGAHTGLTYQPDPNNCNSPPGTTPDTFTYVLNGGSAATVSMTVTCVNDAPVADDETFNGNDSAIGNTTMVVNDPSDGAPNPARPKTTVTGDILAGDVDVDGPGPLTVTPGTFATNDGGSVTIESDGDFTFEPAASTSCADTSDFFDYTVEDSGSPEQTDTGRVTIAIAGCVWYVSNNFSGSPDNLGTSQAPFNTLAQADTASGNNHTVFIFDGDNTTTGYATGYQMNSGERLIGEHEGLVVDPDGGGALTADTLQAASPGAHPTITANNADVISLDDGNEIRGINVDPQGTGGAIFGGAGDTGGGTIDDVNIVDTGTTGTQPGLELNGTTGTFNISNFTVNNDATGVLLNNADVDFAGDSGVVTLDSNGAPALHATNTNMNTSTFDDIVVTNSGSGGVLMDTTSGTAVLGDGTGTDLNLTTTSGATPALDLNNAGTILVGSAATDELHATGGPAIDVTNTANPTLDFDDVDSTSSSTDAINLDGLGTGTFTATSGDIGSYAGIGFDLHGGSGTITYRGNFNDTALAPTAAATVVEVTGRSGGAVSFAGAISDTNDAGGGIVVGGAGALGNTGGSTTFSGAPKTLNTGAGDAVVFTNSDGHTLSLTGGGLDIDTTSGQGLNATTSGTLVVSGSANTINATGLGAGNRALNVSDTDLDASDVTFQSINSSNGLNAIRLNNTGAAGNLAITGTGGACATTADACTGGTVQAASGDAISLTSTAGVELARVKVVNNLGNGIRGSGVSGFSLDDSVVDNNADDAATDEAGLHFTNLGGTADITRTLVSNHLEDNARIINSSATLTQLDVTDSTFRDTDTVSPGNNGLLLQADGGSITADVLGATFLRNRANGLQVVTNGTGSMNVEVDDSAGVQSSFNDNNIGVNIAHNSSGSFTYGVRDLTVDGLNVAPGTGGSASPINLNLAAAATTTMNGRVTGNTLTNSNSTTGPGIRMIGNGAATMTALVDANSISQVANRGVEIIARDGSNRINATVTNNNVTLNNALAADAIRADAGAVATDTTTICADIRGNTATTTAVGLFGIRVRQRFAGTSYILEGYAGSPTDNAAVQNFLSANNNTATTSADHAGAGFTTIANCPTPP